VNYLKQIGEILVILLELLGDLLILAYLELNLLFWGAVIKLTDWWES
jgi:hypothetical protein